MTLPLFTTGESPALLEAVDRLEQVILAHTGEDVFEEVLKLLFAKLFDERQNSPARFRPGPTPLATASALQGLLDGANGEWAGIFAKDSQFALPPDVLDLSVRELARLDLAHTSLSILDAALEKLLTRSAKGAMGQYFTPRNVVFMAVDVLEPKAGELVIDPACGSGGFLVAALRRALEGKNDSLPRLVGFDFDVKAFRVARMMAAVAGNGVMTLSRRNSLDPEGSDLDGSTEFDRRYKKAADGFCDLVLTNPPFGGDVSSFEMLSKYECCRDNKGRAAKKMSREILFIERCVQLLKPGGRAAIVVPQGIVANGSTTFVRTWLLGACKLLGVVGLHPFAFLPHTSVKTSVIFIEKRRPGEKQRNDSPVFFAVSKRPGKDSAGRFLSGDGTTCYGNGDDLRAIALAFRAHRSGDSLDSGEGISFSSVDAAEVLAAERFDAEYFDAKVLAMLQRLRELGAKPLRAESSQEIASWKNRGGIIDYVDISSVDNRTGQILSSPIDAAEAPSRATYRTTAGDVLVSTVRPERNSVGLVTERGEGELVASNGFCVLRSSELAPELLFAYCKTQAFKRMLSRCATATMYPAVSDADVLNVPIPPIPTDIQKQVEANIRSAHEQLANARRLIAGAVGILDDYMGELTGPSDVLEQEQGLVRP